MVPLAAAASLAQQVRFARSPDGTELAFARIGRGPPVVRAAYWLTHLEQDRSNLVWGPWLREFAQHASLIRYDQRGCGLSSRDVADISLEAWLADLETVVEAAGLNRFTLLGMSQGAAISIAYAIQHPERVERLVIYGGYAQGRRRRNSAEQTEEADLQERAILLGWGRDNPAFRQIFTSQFMANATAEEIAAWDDMQRHSCTAETAARIVRLTHDLDIGDLLHRVRVPTLVMHSTHDARIPFELGRAIAAGIPGAQFVPLQSAGHNLMAREPAFGQFFDEIDRFVGGQRKADMRGLTPRETQFLEQLARGHSNEQIAQAMDVSPKTVRNVVSTLFDKMAVRTRAEAIVKAREAGFGGS